MCARFAFGMASASAPPDWETVPDNRLSNASHDIDLSTPLTRIILKLLAMESAFIPVTNGLRRGLVKNGSPVSLRTNKITLTYNTVEDTTANVDPMRVVHFVFSMLLYPAEWLPALPVSRRTWYLGRRNKAVTTNENAVSWNGGGGGLR